MKNESYRDRVKRLNKQLLGEASRFIAEEDTAYQKFFRGALEKFGVSSPDELEGDKEKEFYDYVDQNWDAGENETDVDEADIKEPNKEDKPKIVDPSQSDIKKVDEEEMVRELIRKELAEMFGDDEDEEGVVENQKKNLTENLTNKRWPDWDSFGNDLLDLVPAFSKYKVKNIDDDDLFRNIPIDLFIKHVGDPKTIANRIKKKTASDKKVKVKVANGKVTFVYPTIDDGGPSGKNWDEE